MWRWHCVAWLWVCESHLLTMLSRRYQSWMGNLVADRNKIMAWLLSSNWWHLPQQPASQQPYRKSNHTVSPTVGSNYNHSWHWRLNLWLQWNDATTRSPFIFSSVAVIQWVELRFITNDIWIENIVSGFSSSSVAGFHRSISISSNTSQWLF